MEAREEILMILKMVQDGKISNEDAAKLIDAIENKGESKKDEQSYRYTQYNTREKKVRKKSFDEKMEEMAEGLENMVSDIVGSTKEAFSNFPEIDPGNWFTTSEKRHCTYEAKEDMKLELIGKNGSVRLLPGEDKINVVYSIYTKQDVDEVMKLVDVRSSDKELFIDASGVDGGVSMEIRIPSINYKSIKAITKNGSLRCCPLNTDDAEFITKNGSLRLDGIKSPVIKAHTKNGSVTLSNCASEKAGVETSNGSIIIQDSEIELLDCNTTNGSIRCNGSKSDNFEASTSNASISMEDFDLVGSKGIMNLKTSNGNVRIKIPDDIGAMFKAQAGRNGRVTVNFPCTINRDLEYEGKTNGYEDAKRKIIITAKTNLGRIDIS
ncbi:MAG TPA: DUF4097 family beta strand repeat-containing protein [Clostridia bacterium]|nr:DUF4097 family beta strand repeat-containing protein [Clostridia bacterium]